MAPEIVRRKKQHAEKSPLPNPADAGVFMKQILRAISDHFDTAPAESPWGVVEIDKGRQHGTLQEEPLGGLQSRTKAKSTEIYQDFQQNRRTTPL